MKFSLVNPLGAALLMLSATCCSYAASPAAGPVVPDAPEGDTATFAGRTDNTVRYLRLGELALENGDVETAVNFLQQALPVLQDPDTRCKTIDLLHAALLNSGRNDDAGNLLATATSSGDFAGREDFLDLMRGRTLFFAGQFEEAVAVFQKLADDTASGNYTSLQALELQGRTLYNLKDYNNSRKTYMQLADRAGTNGMCLLKACEGIIFNSLELNEIEAAQAGFQRLTQEVPPTLQNDFADRINRINWLLQSFNGNTSDMEKSFENAAASSRHSDALLARIALRLSDKYLTLNNFELAIHYGVLSLELAEKAFRQTALRSLIEVQLAADQVTDALKNISLYLLSFPQAADNISMLMLAGNICTQLENFEEALQYYHRLFDAPDTSDEIRYQAAVKLAELYQKTARQQEAIQYFNFAIAHAPDEESRGQLHQHLGEYLYQLGRYIDAVAEFEQSANTGSSRGALWLAQSYYQLKSYRRAMNALQLFNDYGDDVLQLKADYLKVQLTEKLSPLDTAITEYLAFADKYTTQAEGSEAMFQAGLLAMNSSKFYPSEIFREFAVRYPGDRAANALYKAMSIYLTDNREKDAAAIFKQLTTDYPNSKYTVGGYFAMSNFLRQHNRCHDALELLKKLQSDYVPQQPELQPEIFYDQALNYNQLHDYRNMNKVLEELTNRYADHPVAAQGFFLLGDLKMMQSNYTEALKCFQQAQERSGGGVFGYGCTGRLADAAYALYISNNQKQYLRQASECYENLLKVEDLPTGLYYQSLYKLGNCLLEADDQAGALRCYREILYRAQLAKRESRYYPVQWSAKALESAIKLLLPAIRKAPDLEQFTLLHEEAERLLKIAMQLDIPGEEPNRQLEVLNSIEFNAK